MPTLALAVAEVVGKELRLTEMLPRGDVDTRLLRLVLPVPDDVSDSIMVDLEEALAPTDTVIMFEAVCVEETAADCDDVRDPADDNDCASLTVLVTVAPESDGFAVFIVVFDGSAVRDPRGLSESGTVDNGDTVAATDDDADCERRDVRLITPVGDADKEERDDPVTDAVTEDDAVVESHARELFEVSGDSDDDAVVTTDGDCADALDEGLADIVLVATCDWGGDSVVFGEVVDARLCGFDCDSVIDGVSDREGAVVVEMDADGVCVGDRTDVDVVDTEPVVDGLGRVVVVAHMDRAPLTLCARVADVVMVAAVRVTAALKLKLGVDVSLRDASAEAETDTERDAARDGCAVGEFEEVAEFSMEDDGQGELVRVTCVALDEIDGVCVNEYAGDFESYRNDGLTVAVTAADADEESVACALLETDDDDESDTDGFDDEVVDVDIDRADVIEGELECVVLCAEDPVANDCVVFAVAVAATSSDVDAEFVVDRVLDSAGVAEPDCATEFVAPPVSLRAVVLVIALVVDTEFDFESVAVGDIDGVVDSSALFVASPEFVQETELDGVGDSVVRGVRVGSAGDAEGLAVVEMRLAVASGDDVCVSCFTVALVDGLELKLASVWLAVLESAAEPETAVCETTPERDGRCGVRVTSGDWDDVEHADDSAL